MPPIISIVGQSNSGKTTLIERLIPELKRRGYKVGTIKHTHHDVECDKPGKDTARHKASGADAVILASSSRMLLVRDISDDSPDALLAYFDGLDLVITEGYKQAGKPKIEVFRRATGKSPLFAGQKDFIAIASDTAIEAEIPCFDIDAVPAIADFIENRFLRKDGYHAEGSRQ